MLSTTLSPYARVEEESRALAGPMGAWLSDVCDNPARHARFLNTLSLMEHIGSRKIMASQSGTNLRNDTLKHLAEETRHAFFFKRAAEAIAGRELTYDDADTIAGASARQYMGRLDAFIEDALSNRPRETAYLYMSLIVEFRAVWLYRLYQDVLAAKNLPLSLKSVLAEEELHLREMKERLEELDPACEQHTRAFCVFEAERFRALWAGLRAN